MNKELIEFILKRVETIVVAAVISGVMAYCEQHKETKDVDWVGQHMSQKEQKLEQLQKEIDALQQKKETTNESNHR